MVLNGEEASRNKKEESPHPTLKEGKMWAEVEMFGILEALKCPCVGASWMILLFLLLCVY